MLTGNIYSGRLPLASNNHSDMIDKMKDGFIPSFFFTLKVDLAGDPFSGANFFEFSCWLPADPVQAWQVNQETAPSPPCNPKNSILRTARVSDGTSQYRLHEVSVSHPDITIRYNSRIKRAVEVCHKTPHDANHSCNPPLSLFWCLYNLGQAVFSGQLEPD